MPKVYKGTVNIKLELPIKWEDREIKEITLDFSKVNGSTITAAERGAFQEGNIPIIRSMSADYCSRIAASISNVPYRALLKMHSADFDPVWQTVAAYISNKDPAEFYKQYSESDANESEEDVIETDFMLPEKTTPE